MLEGALQEGLVVDVGWLSRAVWSWYSGMLALTYVWKRDYAKAHAMLDALLDHAGNLGTWVEEQQVRSVGTRTAGDAANAEASGFFINLIRHLLVYERGDTLEILEGVPDKWISQCRPLTLQALPTEFGDVTVRLSFSADSRSCTLAVSPIDGRGRKGAARIHLGTLRRQGFAADNGREIPEEVVIRWGTPLTLRLRR
jgi:hypothetical protein